MRSGRLDKFIKIQVLDNAVDEDGAPTQTYTTFKDDIPASIMPLSGSEFFTAAQVESNVTSTIRFRYLDGVRPDMRIIHDNRVFEIVAIVDIKESGRWLELKCNEFVSDAP